MDIKDIEIEIKDFLLRQNINNQYIETVNSAHLYSIYYKILNTVKTRKLLSLQNDISFLIGVKKVKIEISDNANTICIRVPKTERDMVYFKDIVEQQYYKENNAELKVVLGQNTDGEIIIKDLVDMTHLLIAGQTGSGKSVFLNTVIASIINNKNTDFIMVDTKKVELSVYHNLNSLLFPVCTNCEQTIVALNWVVTEMTKRYSLFEKSGVRNIKEYNELHKKKMNRIVIIVDELADLMMTSTKEVESLICRIAQLSRASGIHLVIATQRPSHEILTGLLKANLPTRIAFAVNTKVNSRVILDRNGAEELLGKGDMLFLNGNGDIERLQSTFITTEEVIELVENANKKLKKRIKKQDVLLESVIKYITRKKNKTITATELQEVFKIGEMQASNIINDLEKMKYVGKYTLFSPRKILI